jgi:4-hydroxyphenylpyruvate dioxygenase
MATAAALAGRGFVPLAIPDTYYDDLAARLGLEAGFVEALRRHNILYDRDEGGEFFQFYSATIGQGFFFEIAERQGEYAGYGAPNAPFRIAAQKRADRQASSLPF